MICSSRVAIRLGSFTRQRVPGLSWSWVMRRRAAEPWKLKKNLTRGASGSLSM